MPPAVSFLASRIGATNAVARRDALRIALIASLHLIALATCRYLGKTPNERDLDSCSAAGRSLAAAVIAGALALT